MSQEINKIIKDLGFNVIEELHSSDKSHVLRGRVNAKESILKILTSQEAQWVTKFNQEKDIYQYFQDSGTHFPTAQLISLGDTYILISCINGDQLAQYRYPDDAVPGTRLDNIIKSLDVISKTPFTSSSPFSTSDYDSKVIKYKNAGYLTDLEDDFIRDCLDNYQGRYVINHGDPLLSNIIFERTNDEAILFDWEFTNAFLPGFDLALLHTTLAFDRDNQKQIENAVVTQGIEKPFLANKSFLLARERRMHDKLPDDLTFKFRVIDMLNADLARHLDKLKNYK